MGSVFETFARDLETWSQRYRGRPDQEMLHLLFLALEREEIVSVSYRETLIVQRLRGMPIPQEVQELIHHALVWTWKDEQMHTVYLRGAIVRLGSRMLRTRAYVRQMMGFMGGWAGSVRQHLRWREAPLSHTLASAITFLGTVTGIVPQDARDYLRFRPFRDFCVFNIDAEKTAALCYERMMALIPQLPNIEPELYEAMQRVWQDEQNHTLIFELFASGLDDRDQLAPGTTAESLAAGVAAVGDHFLPRSLRGRGTGAPDSTPACVWVDQGRSDQEKLPRFRELLARTELITGLQERANALNKPIGALTVVIKASFMMGYHSRDRSIVTDPALISALTEKLWDAGCRKVSVGDSRNIYDRFYDNRTVKQVAHYFGIAGSCFTVVDFSDEQVAHTYDRGMSQCTVARTWKEADYRISFAKMRSHTTEQVYLTIGNLDGVGARAEEFLFPERQAQRDTAIMMLMSAFPVDLSLIDAYDAAADGLLGMMGCPYPKAPRRLYAGSDSLAVDMVAARHMGLADPRRSSLINTACHWFGAPAAPIEVSGEDSAIPKWRGPYSNEWTALLSLIAYPVYEFGSGRGALFVPEMDSRAFPALRRVSLPLRAARKSVQVLLGLHHWR